MLAYGGRTSASLKVFIAPVGRAAFPAVPLSGAACPNAVRNSRSRPRCGARSTPCFFCLGGTTSSSAAARPADGVAARAPGQGRAGVAPRLLVDRQPPSDRRTAADATPPLASSSAARRSVRASPAQSPRRSGGVTAPHAGSASVSVIGFLGSTDCAHSRTPSPRGSSTTFEAALRRSLGQPVSILDQHALPRPVPGRRDAICTMFASRPRRSRAPRDDPPHSRRGAGHRRRAGAACPSPGTPSEVHTSSRRSKHSAAIERPDPWLSGDQPRMCHGVLWS